MNAFFYLYTELFHKRSIRSVNGHDHPALLRLYKINFLEFHIWKSLISQHDTLLHSGILIIQTLWDVTEFPSKVLIIRMRTWLYLWRCVNAHLLTFSYATSTPWKCASVILTANNHAIVFRKKPEIVRNIWMRSRIFRKCSRIYWMDYCICMLWVAHTEA